MEFKKSEPVKVTIYGQEFLVKKPTFLQAKKMSDDLKAAGDEKSHEVVFSYLNGLGIPQEVLESMETEHVVALCEFLAPSKKN